MESKSKIWIIASVAAVVIVALAVIVFMQSRKIAEKDEEMAEMTEQMEYEKEQLVREYEDVAVEIEGISYKVNNDSLLQAINREQRRIQDLMEELRTVKATNAKRISQLKSELSSVRKVLAYYVAQVDSLSRENQVLAEKNAELGTKYEAATSEVQTLTEEKEVLQGQVAIASQLEARDIQVEMQTKRGGKAHYVKKVAIIKVSYSILKNNTAKSGNKTAYLRITKPDGQVLYKAETDKFEFENKKILYSAKKNFEYSGKEMQDCMYYTVTETLTKGEYSFELFVDGHIIGRKEIEMKK